MLSLKITYPKNVIAVYKYRNTANSLQKDVLDNLGIDVYIVVKRDPDHPDTFIYICKVYDREEYNKVTEYYNTATP